MNFITKFLEKLSVAESLTVLFSFGVGVSLIFKAGFYNTLGVDWYLNNLSAQQIFLSAVGVVVCVLLGAGFGLVNRLVPKRYWQVPLILLVLFSIGIMGVKIAGIQELQVESTVFLTSLAIGVTLSELNRGVVNENGILLSELNWEERTFLEKISGPLMAVILIILFIYMIYSSGKDKATYLLDDKYKKTYVKIKSDNERWILVEMNGDKVFLMSKESSPRFKIIEYKEIEYFKNNLGF